MDNDRHRSAATGPSSAQQTLEREAHLFSRYLLDRAPPAECVARYVAGHRALLPAEPGGTDALLLAMVRRRPWTLPYLDAAAAVFRPQSLLRSKLLLASAVLEASPHSAVDLLPRRTAPAALMLRLAGYTFTSAIKLVIGGILLRLATRRPRG